MVKKRPLLTIVTPTMNIGRYLSECIESIELQTCKDYEHVFVDSYSTDDTLDIIAEYQKRNPNISIRILKEKPEGVFHAFNSGIKNAQGKYIQFLNGDDYFANNKAIQNIKQIVDMNPRINWLQGPTIFTIKDKYKIKVPYFILKSFFLFSASVKTIACHQATIMSREILNKYNGFLLHRRTGMDPDLYIRLSEEGVPIHFSKPDLAVFRFRKGAVSSINPLRSIWGNWVDFYKRHRYIPVITGIMNSFTKRKLIRNA